MAGTMQQAFNHINEARRLRNATVTLADGSKSPVEIGWVLAPDQYDVIYLALQEGLRREQNRDQKTPVWLLLLITIVVSLVVSYVIVWVSS